jgi:hypothetical protein
LATTSGLATFYSLLGRPQDALDLATAELGNAGENTAAGADLIAPVCPYATVLIQKGFAAGLLGDPRAGLAILDEAWDVAARHGDRESQGISRLRAAWLIRSDRTRTDQVAMLYLQGAEILAEGATRGGHSDGLAAAVWGSILSGDARGAETALAELENDRTVGLAPVIGAIGKARLAILRGEAGTGELELIDGMVAGMKAAGLELAVLFLLGARAEVMETRAETSAALADEVAAIVARTGLRLYGPVAHRLRGDREAEERASLAMWDDIRLPAAAV